MEFQRSPTDVLIVRLVTAGRYAVEGWRLLWRHPSLLLFALLIGVFGAVESAVGSYLQLTHTAYGRHLQAEGRRVAEQMAKEGQTLTPVARGSWWSAGQALGRAGSLLDQPAALPAFQGTLTVLVSVALGDHGGRGLDRAAQLALWLGPLLGLPGLLLGALIAAGFYGVLAAAAQGRGAEWRGFGSSAGTRWLRFALYLVVLSLLLGAPTYLMHVAPALWLGQLVAAWTSWAGPLLLVFFCLTPVLFAAENAGVAQAARASASAVWREPGLVVAWAIGLAVLCLVLNEAHTSVRTALWPSVVFAGDPALFLTQLPVEVLYAAVFALLHAWTAATLFMWWRRTRPAAAEDEIDTADAKAA